MSFGTDGEGNYGYFGADGSLIPFKSDPTYESVDTGTYLANASSGTITVTLPASSIGILVCSASSRVLTNTTNIIPNSVDGVTLTQIGDTTYAPFNNSGANHEHRERCYSYVNDNDVDTDIPVKVSASWNVIGVVRVIKVS